MIYFKRLRYGLMLLLLCLMLLGISAISSNFGLKTIFKSLAFTQGYTLKLETLENNFPHSIQIQNLHLSRDHLDIVIPTLIIQLSDFWQWHHQPMIQSIRIKTATVQSTDSLFPSLIQFTDIITQRLNTQRYNIDFKLPSFNVEGHAIGWMNRSAYTLDLELKDTQNRLFKTYITWRTAQDWFFTLATQQWKIHYPALKIFVTFNGHCQVKQTAQTLMGSCPKLFGHLNHQPKPLIASLKIDRKLQQLHAQINLTMGEAKIHSHVNISPSASTGTWQLNIPHLNHFIPIWQGSIRSHGQFSNASLWPILGQADLIGLKTNTLYTPHTFISIKQVDSGHQLRIDSKKFQIQEHTFKQTQLVLQCPQNETHCRINAHTRVGPDQLTLKAQTGLSNIQISEFNWNHAKTLESWKLQSPTNIAIDWNHRTFELPQTCIQMQGGKACLSLDFKRKIITFVGHVKDWSLHWISQILPDIVQNLQGQATGQWHLTKRWATPWQGQIHLIADHLRFFIPYTQQQISNASGSLEMDTDTPPKHLIKFDIKGQHSQGKVHLKGTVLNQKNLPGTLTLTGDHLSLYHSNFMHLTGHPHLIIQRLSTGQSQLNGTLQLTQVFFEKQWPEQDLPDQTIILGELTHEDTTSPIFGTIKLLIPQPISTEILNLKGNLFGQLMIHFNGSEPITATGEFELKNTIFKEIPEIHVTKAHISFNQSHLDNPQLFVTLDRKLPQEWNMQGDPMSLEPIRVGLRLYGSTSRPQYQYFSEPIAMPSNQILTSLITGGHNAFLTPSQIALFSIGTLSNSKNFAKQLDTFQNNKFFSIIDTISFSSTNSLDSEINNPLLDTVIILTKNLSKFLSLQYQFGLLDNHYQISSQIRFNQHILGQLYLNENGHGINLLKFW
jgi:autotransporter translocation and assembly factor TamB